MSVPQVARLAHSAKAMSEFILGAHHGRPVASETAPQVAAAGTGAAAVAMLTSRDEHAAHGGVAEMISETGIVMSRAAIPPRATESGNALPRTNGRGESAVEYSTGTAIYYGSTIALQAIDPPPTREFAFVLTRCSPTGAPRRVVAHANSLGIALGCEYFLSTKPHAFTTCLNTTWMRHVLRCLTG